MGGPQITRYVVVEIRARRLMLNRWKILPVSKLVLISRMDKKCKKLGCQMFFAALKRSWMLTSLSHKLKTKWDQILLGTHFVGLSV